MQAVCSRVWRTAGGRVLGTRRQPWPSTGLIRGVRSTSCPSRCPPSAGGAGGADPDPTLVLAHALPHQPSAADLGQRGQDEQGDRVSNGHSATVDRPLRAPPATSGSGAARGLRARHQIIAAGARAPRKASRSTARSASFASPVNDPLISQGEPYLGAARVTLRERLRGSLDCRPPHRRCLRFDLPLSPFCASCERSIEKAEREASPWWLCTAERSRSGQFRRGQI
jgi:hypothetical protein